MRQTGKRVNERGEDQVEENLKWHSRYRQCEIIRYQAVPAIEAFLLYHTQLLRILKNRYHNLSVNDKEDRAHAELQMIKHSFAIVCRIQENKPDEESTADMMKQLNHERNPIPENFNEEHMQQHKKLLKTRQRIFALEESRKMLQLLHEVRYWLLQLESIIVEQEIVDCRFHHK